MLRHVQGLQTTGQCPHGGEVSANVAERSAAEAWVAIFLEQQPDYLQAGLESLSVVPVDHPGIVLGQEGNG